MRKRISGILLICTLIAVCLGGENSPTGETVDTYGSVIVDEIISIGDDYTFKCNIHQWPSVIGADIPVKIHAVKSALIAGAKDEHIEREKLQINDFLKTTLHQAKLVVLKNIQRGKMFSLVADVYVDGKSLAELLAGKGLAKQLLKKEFTKIPQQSKVKPKIILTTTSSAPVTTKEAPAPQSNETVFAASKNSKIFHRPTCRFSRVISEKNIVTFDTKSLATQAGRRPCKTCSP